MEDLLTPNHPHRVDCIELNRKRFTSDFLSPFDLIAVSVVFGWYKAQHVESFLAYARSVAPAKALLVFGNYIVLYTDCWQVAARRGVRACGDRKLIASEFLYEDELGDVSQRNGATFVSMRSVFCPDGRCLFVLHGAPFTWDKFHLSYEFSVELGRRLIEMDLLKELTR
jgi:hypothetical protein